MRASYHDIFIHLIWHTWDSLPQITPGLQPSIYACIAAKCQQHHVQVVAIGGTSYHVHLLAKIYPTVSIAELIHDLKGASSHLVTHQLLPQGTFKWQGAYAAFSVSPGEVDPLSAYIHQQPAHHRDQTLRTGWEFAE